MFPIFQKTPFEIWMITQIPAEKYIPRDYLLFYLVSGQLKINISDTHFSFSEGDCFIVQPDESYIIDCDDSFFLCVVRMDFYFMVRCCDYQRPSFAGAEANRRLSFGLQPEAYSRLMYKIDFLTGIFHQIPPVSSVKMTYYFYDFAYFFLENFQSKDSMEQSTPQKRTYAINDYIESNYHLPITLNQLSKELNLTPQYLSAYIKKNMGTTFNKLLYDTRFGHVLLDLVETQDNITKIILNNGFPNASGFNKMFKERYQMTPSEYRKKEWKNNITYKDTFPFHIFTFEGIELYETYQRLRSRQIKNRMHQVVLKLDSTKSHFHRCPWDKILNIKSAVFCLNIDYYNQIAAMQSHIRFKYARIEQLIHPDILMSKDYSKADSIIDNLQRLELIPFIVMLPQSCQTYSKKQDFLSVLSDFIIHSIDRYGITFVSQWKFEYIKAPSEDIKSYAQNYVKISDTLHKISKSIRCGGPSFDLNEPCHLLTDLLTKWAEYDCIPDFITLKAYPLTDDHKISLNPDINSQRMKLLHHHIDSFFKAHSGNPKRPPLYITETGFSPAGNNYMNDTVFMAAYLLKNFIDMKPYAEMIAYPAFSDLTSFTREYSGDLLIGGNGLITIHSIFKPVFFALKYLCELGQSIIDSGNGYIVTLNANKDVILLLYHYRHPDAYYCGNTQKLKLEQIDSFYDADHPMCFEISIKNLPAPKYQAARFLLNKDSGSILNCWADSGGIHDLKNEVINYLRQTLAPKISFYTLSCNPVLNIKESLEAQEIVMLVLRAKY